MGRLILDSYRMICVGWWLIAAQGYMYVWGLIATDLLAETFKLMPS